MWEKEEEEERIDPVGMLGQLHREFQAEETLDDFLQ